MGLEKRLLLWAGIVVPLASIALPIYVSYELHRRGPIPEKKIVLTKRAESDVMSTLSLFAGKARISLQMENENINNLVISDAMLKNAGTSPILPKDYYENISVNVKKPWKILAVEDKYGISFKWKKMSDSKFEAEPALLNPGDTVYTSVYVTNTQIKKGSALSTKDRPNVKWKARILNMRGFTTPPKVPRKMPDDIMNPFISFTPKAGLFTIAIAILFQALYLHFLSLTGYVKTITLRTIPWILGITFLSWAAAESTATYLFRPSYTMILGVSHLMNAPWIIANAVILIILYRMAKRSHAST